MGVHVDTSQLRILAVDLSAAPAEVQARVPVAVKSTLARMERTGQVLAPVDTGNLMGSISTDMDGDGMGGEVGPTAEYGAYVEYGTGPHTIRPHVGGRLVFTVGGQLVFADVVHHPGTSPQPYMGPAFDRHVPGFVDALGDIGVEVID